MPRWLNRFRRIRAACANSGAGLPARRITVNLSPAAVPKHGSGFDLAIAMAIAAAQGLVPKSRLVDVVWLGELGLDGSVRPAAGTLATTLASKRLGFKRVVVAASSYAEAAMVAGIEVIAVAHLRELLRDLWPTSSDAELPGDSGLAPAIGLKSDELPDLSDVIGQPDAIRALEVAAAGGHHLLLVGPPGAGKTLLAQRLPGILPPLSSEQAIETLALRSPHLQCLRAPNELHSAFRGSTPRCFSSGTDWWRFGNPSSGLGLSRSQRCAVSRRGSRVLVERARLASPAARIGGVGDFARSRYGSFSR